MSRVLIADWPMPLVAASPTSFSQVIKEMRARCAGEEKKETADAKSGGSGPRRGRARGEPQGFRPAFGRINGTQEDGKSPGSSTTPGKSNSGETIDARCYREGDTLRGKVEG